MKISIFSTAIVTVLALVLGIWIGSKFTQTSLTNCDSPENMRTTKSVERSEVLIEWNHGTRQANEYMIVVYQENGGTRTPFGTYLTTSNSFVLNELEAKKNYYVELFSRCGTGQDSHVLSDVLTTSFDTQEFIIVDEVVHVNPSERSPVEQDACNNMNCSVIGSPNNSFPWLNAASGKEYYNIQIRPRGVGPQPLLANAYLVKDFTNASDKKVTSLPQLRCGGTVLDALNAPLKTACIPQLPNVLCGSFTNGGSVGYEVLILSTGCTVRFVAPAQANDYSVSVSRCTGAVQ